MYKTVNIKALLLITLIIVPIMASIPVPVRSQEIIDLKNVLQPSNGKIIANLSPSKTYVVKGLLVRHDLEELIINGNGATIIFSPGTYQGIKIAPQLLLGNIKKIVIRNVNIELNSTAPSLSILYSEYVVLENIRIARHEEIGERSYINLGLDVIHTYKIMLDNIRSKDVKSQVMLEGINISINNVKGKIDFLIKTFKTLKASDLGVDSMFCKGGHNTLFEIKDTNMTLLSIKAPGAEISLKNINITNSLGIEGGADPITANIESINTENLGVSYGSYRISGSNISGEASLRYVVPGIIKDTFIGSLKTYVSIVKADNIRAGSITVSATPYLLVRNSIIASKGRPLTIFGKRKFGITTTVLLINNSITARGLGLFSPSLIGVSIVGSKVFIGIINSTISLQNPGANFYLLYYEGGYGGGPALTAIIAGNNITGIQGLVYGLRANYPGNIYFYGNNIHLINGRTASNTINGIIVGQANTVLAYNNIFLNNFKIAVKIIKNQELKIIAYLNNFYSEKPPDYSIDPTINITLGINTEYIYRDKMFTGTIGNYYSWINGTDTDEDGKLDEPVTVFAVKDNAALAEPMTNYILAEGLAELLVPENTLLRTNLSLEAIPEFPIIAVNGIKKINDSTIDPSTRPGSVEYQLIKTSLDGSVEAKYTTISGQTITLSKKINVDNNPPSITGKLVGIKKEKKRSDIDYYIKVAINTAEKESHLAGGAVSIIKNGSTLGVWYIDTSIPSDRLSEEAEIKINGYMIGYSTNNLKIMFTASDIFLNTKSYTITLREEENNTTTTTKPAQTTTSQTPVVTSPETSTTHHVTTMSPPNQPTITPPTGTSTPVQVSTRRMIGIPIGGIEIIAIIAVIVIITAIVFMSRR